ncbi:hypothetical protein MN608_11625 [Microdochium nivale]|nr:hypothetical protein MN608_11625 [Microdochium nivale]
MRRSMVVRDNGIQTWRSDWCEVGLAVDYYTKGGYDHAVAIKDGEYQHVLAKHGVGYWDGNWTPLGLPHERQDLAPGELGFPRVISLDKVEAEVIAVCSGKIWHKTRNADGG